jgi:formiminotetrahydrofolate cyclodeaminase
VGTIWDEPLESLYQGLAAAKPAPAGVTAAAVSARFGVALLIKTLEITAKRDDSPQLRLWIVAAKTEAETLAQAANDDITAQGAAPERKRIEIPMIAAGSAAAGLELCAEAAGSIRGALAADLEVAAMLLCSAVRGILMCVDSNAGDFEADQRREMEGRALGRLEAIRRT